jgi:(p)ppGpp synthase/HD superfamily hydrolase
LLKELGMIDIDEVYEQLGLGERLAPVIAGMLSQQIDVEGETATQLKPLDIAGTEGLLVSYAGCCHPIPDDDILGYMSTGRGVVIHRSICNNVGAYRKHPSKWIPIDWRKGLKGEFQSEIQVKTLNRVGLLAEIAGRISAALSNIVHVNVETDEVESTLIFRLNVRNRRHLAQVIRSIRTNPSVMRVSRSAS